MATDASASAVPAPPADPYVTARANLRDTVKWLAATFSALAAVVIAGSPVSGLGKLHRFTGEWFGACLTLLLAFGCICAALAITVRLLRGDLLYMSDLAQNPERAPAAQGFGRRIKAVFPSIARSWRSVRANRPQVHLDEEDRIGIAALRANLDAHAVDVLPFGFPTVAQLMEEDASRRAELGQAWDAWYAAQGDAAATIAAEAQVLAARSKRQHLAPVLQGVMVYASYFVFYDRLRRAMRRLFPLGIASLVLLAAFGMFVDAPEKPPSPAMTVVNNAAREPAASEPMRASPLPALNPILFRTGDASLDSESLKRVDLARAALRANPHASLLLHAYTDTVAGANLNNGLAHRRGSAVRMALIREGGVEAGRILVAEQPGSGLPELTRAGAESQTNRSVVMKLVDLPH